MSLYVCESSDKSVLFIDLKCNCQLDVSYFAICLSFLRLNCKYIFSNLKYSSFLINLSYQYSAHVFAEFAIAL